MDTSFVDRLLRRAERWLPAATVMALECAGDESGDPALQALLEQIQSGALAERALCGEPYEPVVFDDRVLLRCAGCPRAAALPKIAGVGRGRTEQEARRNALYALTLPLDRYGRPGEGLLAELSWGEGPVQVTEMSCVLDRVAYRDVTA